MCLCCLCTRLVPFGHQFGRVDDPIDGGLGDGVLLLQQLDGLPQVVQLRVLRGDGVQPTKLQVHPACAVSHLLLCGQRETLQSDGHVAQALLKRRHQVSLEGTHGCFSITSEEFPTTWLSFTQKTTANVRYFVIFLITALNLPEP